MRVFIVIALIYGAFANSLQKRDDTSCEYNGQVYQSGQNFPSADGCNQCSCQDGIVMCTLIYCEACKYKGEEYPSGASFPKGDGCNTCFCKNGEVLCTKINCDCAFVRCAFPDCDHPIPPRPGKCCYTCPPHGKEETCRFGPSAGQCGGIRGFRCHDPDTVCMFIDPDIADDAGLCCYKNARVVPREGQCPVSTGVGECVNECFRDYECKGNKDKCCKNGCGYVCLEPVLEGPLSCLYYGVVHQSGGDSFDSFEGCNTCMCIDGSVACTEKACQGCPDKDGGEGHEHGETWNDGCNECSCTDGSVLCTIKECDPE